MNNNLTEIKKTNSDCASYTGTVTVASYLGDRLIKKETSHNEGLNNLFEFLGNCLQGNWHEARSKRPCKLVMLKTAPNENLDKTNTLTVYSTPLTQADYWSAQYAVGSPVMYDTAAPSVFTNEDETGPSSSVTYHFRIPFLSLVSGSEITKLMLLPPVASNYAADACAYYILQNPIEVPSAGGNFTVIIDWTLTFTNNIN